MYQTNTYENTTFSTKKYKTAIEFPELTKKDIFILYLYTCYLGYKLIYKPFENKRVALVIDGLGRPGLIQKRKNFLKVVYKDGIDTINPPFILENLMKRGEIYFANKLRLANLISNN